MKKIIAFASIVTMTTAPAFAGLSNFVPSGFELGVGVSATSGLNGFVGYANKNLESFWWKRLGVRFDFASTKPIKGTINSLIDRYMDDGIEIGDNLTITDGTIDSKHFAALVDFYPFGNTWFLGGWRLTGGYVFGDMKIKAMLTGSDDRLNEFAGRQFELGDTIYKYTGGDVHGTANAKWDFHGPYAGTGFDLGLFRGFKIFFDAGVVFTSKAAELSLDIPNQSALQYSTDGGNSWSTVNLQDKLQSDIDDTLGDAQKKLDEYKFFPMVKLGFMYRF